MKLMAENQNGNENKKPVDLKETSRKRTIKQTFRHQLKARKMPNIGAGICEFCGHPPYKCPSCKVKLHQIGPDVKGRFKWPKICPQQNCEKPIPDEAVDALAFCEHYADVRHDLVCIYCKDPEAVQMRMIQVRAIPQADGTEELVTVCSDIRCRRSFFKEHVGADFDTAQ